MIFPQSVDLKQIQKLGSVYNFVDLEFAESINLDLLWASQLLSRAPQPINILLQTGQDYAASRASSLL